MGTDNDFINDYQQLSQWQQRSGSSAPYQGHWDKNAIGTTQGYYTQATIGEFTEEETQILKRIVAGVLKAKEGAPKDKETEAVDQAIEDAIKAIQG